MSYAHGTPNYNLPLTQGSDKRDWADTNAAFTTLDTAVKTANDSATAAGSAASTAQSKANSASTAASNAQNTANSAVSSAAAAAELAQTAKNRADSAYTLANTAKTGADNAYSKADNAYSKAETNAQDIDRIEGLIDDSGWTVLNQSYNAYYRKIGKVVLVQFTLGATSVPSGTTLTLGTLPASIRPTYTIVNAAVCGPDSATLGYAVVNTSGVVAFGHNSGSAMQYGQGSITFMI